MIKMGDGIDMNTNRAGRKNVPEKKKKRSLREWWRKKRSSGAGLSKRQRKRFAILIWISLVILPSLVPYCLYRFRTFLAIQELNRNSNLTYRLEQRLSEEELEENFVFYQTKYKSLNGYSLKEQTGNVSMATYARYPNSIPMNGSVNILTGYVLYDLYKEISCQYPFVVTEVLAEGTDFHVLGIERGMDMEEAARILKKKGYKNSDINREYFKGAVWLYVIEERGKVEGVKMGLYTYQRIKSIYQEKILGK